MKTKVWKRIGALVLALALIVSGVPQMCIEALAETTETTTSEFIVTGIDDGTEVLSDGTWRVKLNYTGTFDAGGTWGAGDFTTWMNYIIDDEVKGSAYGVQFYQTTESTENSVIALHIPKSVVPSDGTADLKFVIQARTWTNVDTNADGTAHSYTMTNDLVLYFNEYGISLNKEIAEPSTSIYVESITNHDTNYAVNCWNQFRVNMSAEDPFETGTMPKGAEGLVDGEFYFKDGQDGIWVGDEFYYGDMYQKDTDLQFKKIDSSLGDYFLYPRWYNIADRTRIKLEGRFVSNGVAVNIETSIMEFRGTLEQSATGGKWTLLSRLTELADGTKAESDGWKIFMNHVGTFDYKEGETFSWNAEIDGVATTVPIYYENGCVVIAPTAEQIPIEGASATLILKAGDVVGSLETKATIVNDVTFCINKYGVALDEFIEEPKEEYIESIYDIAATTKSTIYFKMSEVDAFGESMIVGDEDNISPVAMTGLVDGVYYKENQNGIWIDDTWYAPNATAGNPGLVKMDNIRDGNQQDYYISLWHVQDKINDGTKIYLKGLFGDGGKYADITESIMQWNVAEVAEGEEIDPTKGTWILLPRLLDVAKTPTVEDGKWKISMNYVGTLAGEEGEVFASKVYVDETAYDVSIYSEGDYLVLEPAAEAFPTDGTDATIVLKAGDITSDKGSTSMIVNDVTICVNKYGVSLDEPIPSYTIVADELDSMTNYAEETWNIYMKQSGSFLGEAEETFEWPATIAGTDGTVTVYATKVDGTVYFNPVIPDSDTLKPSTGNVSVVIKAGTVTGSNGTENELKEDVVLYFDKNGLSTTGSSGEYGEATPNVKLALVSPYTWDTGIYFKPSKADNIVGDSSWNVRPLSLSGFVDGVCYRGDGGIYITDADGNTTKYAPNTATSGVPSFIKIGNYGTNTLVYYIGINKSQTVEVGTKVEIKGVFAWDGQLAEIASTVLQWNGSEWLNITPADVENIKLTLSDGNADYFDLKTTDTISFSEAAFYDAMPGEENGVYYNGVRTSTQLWRNSNTAAVHDYYRVLLYGQDIEAEVGDEVLIKGRFTTNCYIVHFVEQAWVFDGSKWTETSLPTKVELKDTEEGDTETSLGFTVEPEDGLEVDAVNAYNFTTGGIYVNGIYNATPQLYKVGSSLYKVDLTGLTFVVGDTVTIDGTVESDAITVEYQYTVFTYEGNGVWSLTKAEAPEKPIRFELDMQSSKLTENGWELILKATDGLRGDPGIAADATYTGLTLFVNGTEYSSESLLFKNSDSYYEMTVPTSVIPTTGTEYKIIIKKGMITGGWEESGRYMEKELVLYVSGDRISDKGTPVGTEDVSISCSGGDSKTVKFLASGTDAMLVNTTSGTGILAADDTNSGVFINGVKKSNVALYKYEDSGTYYQADLSSITYTPVTGDVVLINGTFELSNYYVTFVSAAAKWNGSTWEAISDVSAINLNNATCDAADDAFIIDPEGTTVNAETVKAGKVLYKEGTYTIVYSIGSAKMTQSLTITNTYSAAANNGAGKAEDYEGATLPDMVTDEANAAGNYINNVAATEHGTTVISMDGTGEYQSSADFDDYGLDYIVDLGIEDGRDIKVLQLSDTQTIDSEQQRYSGRISATLAAQTVPEKQFENMQYYIDKVVEVSKPDVILIAGDLIYTEFDDDGSMWLDLIEYMDSLQIPWAPIFGNHDQESIMGVEWQCEQMMKSTYCLFNRRHEGIGGNCNYSIGLARNGKLEKAIYMLDSNGCGNVAKSGNTYSTWGYDSAGNMTEVRAASGFYDTQIEWYRTTAMRVNEVAGKTIPSVQCYHIGSEEILFAARAAGYQYGEDSAAQKYGMSNDDEAESYLESGNTAYTVKAQSGDSGYKMGTFSDLHRETGLLEIMNAVGTNGVFLGHNHTVNTSTSYGGVRWTYGLKTGIYADDTVNKGGTLITMDTDSAAFTVEQIQVELEYSEPTLDADKVADNAADTIYLNGNATRDDMAVQTEALVVTNDEESGIFINAVKSDAVVEKYAEDKYKVTLPTAANVGDVVSVYGIFENSTGTHAVYFQKTLVAQWDGTQWNAVAVDWLNGSTVSVNAIGADYEKAQSYTLHELGILPLQLDVEGNKISQAITAYGDNQIYCKLDNVTYAKTVALYIPGDSHVDEELDALDLVAMKKAEYGETATTATESYADELGCEKLRSKLVGK